MPVYEKKFYIDFPEPMTVSGELMMNPPRFLIPFLKSLDAKALRSDAAGIWLHEFSGPLFDLLLLQADVRQGMEAALQNTENGLFFLMGIRGDAVWTLNGYPDGFSFHGGIHCAFSAPTGKHLLQLPAGQHQYLLVYASAHLSRQIVAEWPELKELYAYMTEAAALPVIMPALPYPQSSVNLIGKLAASEQTHWSLHKELEHTVYLLFRNYAKHAAAQEQRGDKETPTLRERAMEYIRSHYTEPGLNKGSVAKAMAVSGSTLDKAFHNSFIGVYHYILALRLLKGRELVCLTNKPFREIAWEVGFGEASNFSHAFKKRFSKSPSECREEANGMGL